MADPIKSLMHNFVFDERTHLIVSSFMQAVSQTVDGGRYFAGMCHQYGITNEELKVFMQEWSDHEHDMGWCHDPNCKVPNRKQS